LALKAVQSPSWAGSYVANKLRLRHRLEKKIMRRQLTYDKPHALLIDLKRMSWERKNYCLPKIVLLCLPSTLYLVI
jgi:hypothetical protein